jgi:hypothetical protein
MKKLISVILMSSCLGLQAQTPFAFADAKSEGVSTEIDSKRLNDVITEVNNSKFTLDTESENIAKSDIADQEKMYANLLEQLLAQSGTKPNEFLMRNILYRTQSIYVHVRDLPPSPKRDVFARRILEQGIAWAQKLYEPDKKLLSLAQQKQLPDELRGATFANIGLQWARYVLNLYYLSPTSAAKLQLMRDMMGQLYNDILNDDAVKRIEAPVAGNLAMKNDWLNNQHPTNPVDKLTLSRDLRRFMESHLNAAEKLLAQYPMATTVLGSAGFSVQQEIPRPQAISYNQPLNKVEFYQSDRCSGSYIGAVNYTTSCSNFASLAPNSTVYAFKINNTCYDISDLSPESACENFKTLDASKLKNNVVLYQSDHCSSAVVTIILPTTNCDSLENLNTIYGIRDRTGTCRDISDTSADNPCKLYRNE